MSARSFFGHSREEIEAGEDERERDIRIAELVALHDAASRCDCGQECYCAKNLEYAEMKLEELGVDPTKIHTAEREAAQSAE